jgi:L-seryl-tRNA(Ser) seleniumtransferase
MSKIPAVYERIGVRPFINAVAPNTIWSGSLMRPEVLDAMREASGMHVMIADLHEKVGQRLCELTGAEAAYVSDGCASGLLLCGAAAMTGTDLDNVHALPDTDGRPNQFIISRSDQHSYIPQGFKSLGGECIFVGTREKTTVQDYEAAITDKTAALVYFIGGQSKEEVPETAALAQKHNIKLICDSAAQLPPRSNLCELHELGMDAVIFSGGKNMGGPQSSGLILGKKDMIQAAAMNGSPNRSIGRGMKVGKEEIIGLLTAVELFLADDEHEISKEWDRRLRLMADAVTGMPGVTLDVPPAFGSADYPARPYMRIYFDDSASISAEELQKRMYEGEPSIWTRLPPQKKNMILMSPMVLRDGDAEIVARRLNEELSGLKTV